MRYISILSSRLLLSVFLITALIGCQSDNTHQPAEGESTMPTPISSWSQPFHTLLTKGTTLRIFEAIPEQYKTYTEDMVTITFTCTVFEGFFCWIGPAYRQNPLPGELIDSIIREIDPKRIEHAKDNEVQLRCTKPIDGDERLRCEVMLSDSSWVEYPLSD